jgi:hypothetical protein
MFHNGAEVTTGIIVYQSGVHHSKFMKGLAYFGDQTSLLNDESIIAHTTEAIHQVEVENVVEGGWVGGNAWFDSVMAAIEVKKMLGEDSTWNHHR